LEDVAFDMTMVESVTPFLDSEGEKEHFFPLGVGFFWERVNNASINMVTNRTQRAGWVTWCLN